MARVVLSDLSRESQAQLKQELGIEEQAIGLLQWEEPRKQARIIVEVWPRDAASNRPIKRYILSRIFWWKDAISFVATWECDNINHTIVAAEEAAQRIFDMEFARPSDEFVRVGRIWDCRLENCRAAERIIEPRGVPAPFPAFVQQEV
jgi:hypothetical protein